jgi:ABC-type transport system involved in multi-copper enzyme maturation permease subunit
MTAAEQATNPRRLALGQIATLVAYTLREARHKWTLMAIFVLTTFFLLLLLTLVNVDVVEGTIASARLFGSWDLPIGDQSIQITEAVTVIQSIIVGFLSSFGLLLSLFITGNIIPRTLEAGWVDLLVAQPVSRPIIILGRTLGAVAVVALAIAYLFGGSWAILTFKTGFGNAGFLVAGLVILFTFIACYAGMVLVGVVTGSSPISIIAGVGIWFLGQVMYWLHHFEEWTTAFRVGWPRTFADTIAETLYWALPKTAQLTARSIEATRQETLALGPAWASLPFAVVCIALACWWFSRQDY